MEPRMLALLIGVICAVVFGYFTARTSAQRDTIYGGQVARFFHYIGAAAASGTVPVVLANVFLGQGFGAAVLSAIGFFAVGFISLTIYAVLDLPARKQLADDDAGWTKEDALTSQL
jgi:hypothetical protein